VTADGFVTWSDNMVPCALVRSGVTRTKREGDGATPAGSFALLEILYRPDRLTCPQTPLPTQPLAANDGWCDDPGDPAYNQPVKLPYGGRCETLWRDDGLYDLIGVIGYNVDPVTPGLGSAIFLHVATSDFQPTEGCVALALPDLKKLLAEVALPAWIEISA
jgi:L,D-peptidoglycan transpeptidase YkuD (ErfK/YbiS/YcfS/YnhG family)